MFSAAHISAYVLAGGKSSRMGNDKGLMLLGGKPMVSYALQTLQTCFESITIISANRQYEQFGYPVIPDATHTPAGAAAGIYTALQHGSAQWRLVVSCDMPFITPQGIQLLAAHATPAHEIVLATGSKGAEPLFALYAVGILPRWQNQMEQGVLKLQTLIAGFTCCQLPIAQNPVFAPPFFMNLNTPPDFTTAQQFL
ncbi:MAG TPA: molybdenum cofactor guanylyltransferase [Chitinophagales bacterium]|nr:molybdenum cofactor guanylyltransferase [Chitinophagales bacterium]HRK25707.1 molybdenum cofactor guanylyltransferase [Chitinophagales bacterium]